MKILSNSEFVYLTTGQAPRLQRAAKERYSKDPEGILTGNDIAAYKKVFAYSGDKAAVRWLDNLMIFTKNGTISRIKTGKTTWADHVDEISRRVAKGELPFDLGQHVVCKESGRYGSVVDYIPDSEEYIVVLDPFQVTTYKKGDLKKVAQTGAPQAPSAQPDPAQQDPVQQYENPKTLAQWLSERAAGPTTGGELTISEAEAPWSTNTDGRGSATVTAEELLQHFDGNSLGAENSRGNWYRTDHSSNGPKEVFVWGTGTFGIGGANDNEPQEAAQPATASKKVADNTDWGEDRGYEEDLDVDPAHTDGPLTLEVGGGFGDPVTISTTNVEKAAKDVYLDIPPKKIKWTFLKDGTRAFVIIKDQKNLINILESAGYNVLRDLYIGDQHDW